MSDRHGVPEPYDGAHPFEVIDSWAKLPPGVSHLDVADVGVRGEEVFLLTRNDPAVVVVDLAGEYLRHWGSADFSARPHGLTVTGEGSIWIVDEEHHCVSRYDGYGTLELRIGDGNPSDTGYQHGAWPLHLRLNTIVLAAQPFNRPTKLAVGANGDPYVSDGYGNARIHRFTGDGEHVASWGTPGVGPGEFHLPHSIVATDDGLLVVADRENERLQVFDLDGRLVGVWLDVQRPCALTVEPATGNILVGELMWSPGETSYKTGFVSTSMPARFSLFDSNGVLLGRWAEPGDGLAVGSVVAPHGMAFDGQGRLYVAEVSHTFCTGRDLDPTKYRTFGAYLPGVTMARREGVA